MTINRSKIVKMFWKPRLQRGNIRILWKSQISTIILNVTTTKKKNNRNYTTENRYCVIKIPVSPPLYYLRNHKRNKQLTFSMDQIRFEMQQKRLSCRFLIGQRFWWKTFSQTEQKINNIVKQIRSLFRSVSKIY